ncbi:VOC family protein [Paenibacillus sp. S-38]|uniref:VOC family protein n=1 Tax=Paenibacillus sp. S-38 TaxID=3416710 RepID=UPI003CF7B962
MSTLSASRLQRRIGSVFIPVRNIERARDWYVRLLGITEPCEIQFGHLCILPTVGPDLILDTMPMWGGRDPEGAPPIRTPSVLLPTDDLQASYAFMQEQDIKLVTGIEHGHWFVIEDPDGNRLMICGK